MKPEELRIGNYVEWENKIYEVFMIAEDAIFIDNEIQMKGKTDGKDIKSIPLTEQWLIDFGFKKGSKKVAIYVIKKFSLIFYSSPRYDTTYNYASYFDGDLETRIKYVHQLQNLYFALTGKELTK